MQIRKPSINCKLGVYIMLLIRGENFVWPVADRCPAIGEWAGYVTGHHDRPETGSAKKKLGLSCLVRSGIEMRCPVGY